MSLKSIFKSKITLWVGIFALLTGTQVGTLYKMDRFLQPPSLSAMAALHPSGNVQGDNNGDATAFDIPLDAVRYAISTDKTHAAYTTADHHLVVMDRNGSSTFETTGDVPYLKWLGSSHTLLYFVQGTYLDAYLLQTGDAKPLLIHEWWGNSREVVNDFFSPYLEFLYIEVKNGSDYEVYKYDAVSGIRQLPLESIKIARISYDDLSDVMEIVTTSGQIWHYANGRLYRPDGSEVYQSIGQHNENAQKPSNRSTGANSAPQTAPSTKTNVPSSSPGSPGSLGANGTGTGQNSTAAPKTDTGGSTGGNSSNSAPGTTPASSGGGAAANPPVSSNAPASSVNAPATTNSTPASGGTAPSANAPSSPAPAH